LRMGIEGQGLGIREEQKQGQRQEPIRGSFAPLRMTAKNKQRQQQEP
jgi:hypothetical protein